MGAVLEGLRGLGPAPGLADNAAPANLLGMAGAVHETIAARMNARDRAMLACSHPALRDSLRAFSISDKAVVQGRDVGNLEKFRAVLQEVRSLPERPDLQARPLAVLAGRLGALPNDRKDDRKLAFDDILATIMQAPAQRRGPMDVPLMMLAGQMGTLALPEQPGAFQRLLLAQPPPGSQAEGLHDGLHLLAGRIGDLPEAAGQQAFTQVLRRAARLEPGLLEGMARPLVGQLRVLPEAAQWPAFSGLLEECSSLAPEQRAVMLKALTHEIGALPEPHRLPAVQEVLAAAESLAPEAWQPEWQATLQAVEQLPPSMGGVTLLGVLANQIGKLPMDARAAAFESVLQVYRAWPEPYRLHSASVLGIGCLALPRAQWPHALDRVLDEVARVDERVRTEPLLMLAFTFCLAEPAANGPIDPRQPDNPRLDVQTQCVDKIMGSIPPLPRRTLATVLQSAYALYSQEVQAQVAQRPDDADFLTAGLERFRQLTECSTAPRASGGWLARLSRGLRR